MERMIMAKELQQFTYYESGTDRFFQGWHTVLMNGLSYLLKVVLPVWYPDEMPNLYVVSPIILWKYDGTMINSKEISHAFHTNGLGPGGCAQLCHCNPSEWDASATCWGVSTKGILWLEAYGVHLVTGRSIADILYEWRRRQL
jgi:hypothetical protein